MSTTDLQRLEEAFTWVWVKAKTDRAHVRAVRQIRAIRAQRRAKKRGKS